MGNGGVETYPQTMEKINEPGSRMNGLRAIRVRLDYDKHGMRCSRIVPVLKVTPTYRGPLPQQGQCGLWIEMRDKDQKVLYCRVLNSALEFNRELHGPKPKAPPRRVAVPDAQGFLSVVLPDLDTATNIVVMSGPLVPDGFKQPAEGRLDLQRQANGTWKANDHGQK
jgi:hypothetical protein